MPMQEEITLGYNVSPVGSVRRGADGRTKVAYGPRPGKGETGRTRVVESVVVLPSASAVAAYRKECADARDPASFGTAAMTAAAWLDMLWGVYGDGRRIASRRLRTLAMLKALDARGEHSPACSEPALPATLGVASLLARLVEGGLGAPAFDAATADPSRARPCDVPLLVVANAYERTLADCGAVDPGRAWALLCETSALAAPARVTFRGCAPSAALGRFLESRPAVELVQEPLSCVIERAREGVDVRFAFPAGRYAEPKLLVDLCATYASDGAIAIAARDPRALYDAMADGLAREGIACDVRSTLRFDAVDFGRAFLSAHALLSSEGVDSSALADYLLNPFSGISPAAAFEFDARVRGDRLFGKDACLSRLREKSRLFEYLEEWAATPDADMLAGVCEDAARARQGERGEAWAREQCAAISALRDMCEAARDVGLSMDACIDAVAACPIPASRSTAPAPDGEEGAAASASFPRVSIMGLPDLADAGPEAYATAILCDMTSDSYPLRERHDAASDLLERLGIVSADDALSSARRAFRGALRAASGRVVIERCLNDADAESTYPAAVVEEFVDRYRADARDASEVDNPYALPPCFLENIVERGEELLYRNAAVGDDPQPVAARAPRPSLSRVSEPERSRLVLPRELPGRGFSSEVCLSASQIESYLECPQKWFAQRRLRLDELDEGFGPVEMGDFSHAVLHDFYLRFQQEVAPKVTRETLDAARAIMRDTAREHAAEQPKRPFGDNRLVPISELERRELDELGDKLVRYLDREVELLPGFRPAYFEYDIPVAHAVDYAGCRLIGSVDRIDVDDAGRAVVIDYKSSLSPAYDLYEPERKGGAFRKGKVQALVYAQAVRRRLGLDVIGAVYVSYGRSRKASGAVDASIEASHVPGMPMKTCVFRPETLAEGATFSDLVDATEHRVAEALSRLFAGEVPPLPAHDGVCAHCPENSCPNRRG